MPCNARELSELHGRTLSAVYSLTRMQDPGLQRETGGIGLLHDASSGTQSHAQCQPDLSPSVPCTRSKMKDSSAILSHV